MGRFDTMADVAADAPFTRKMVEDAIELPKKLNARIEALEAELAQERSLRQHAEQIAADCYADLMGGQAAAVAAREERERVRETILTLRWPNEDERSWRDILLEFLFPDNLSAPPPPAALASRLAEALAALEPFALVNMAAATGEPFAAHIRRAREILIRRVREILTRSRQP